MTQGASDADTELAAFPFEKNHPFDPPKEIVERRERCPVSRVRLFDDKEAWLVTRYEDVRTVCIDPRFSSDTTDPGFPEVFSGRSKPEEKERTFISIDPPEHDVIRRMLTSSFVVKRAESWRPRIQDFVDTLIDVMLAKGPEADLVRDFALPIPTTIICWLLGVPVEDHEFFQERAGARLDTTNSAEVVARATKELMDYLADLVAVKEAEPGDDLISKLLEEQVRPGNFTREQLVDHARVLLIAGHESTASMIALSTLVLLEHPGQLEELRADPDLFPAAVEELLRYLTIAQLLVGRVAKEDVEIGGTLIQAGDGVRALLNSANRDARAFDDPDRFDIHRDARHHLAFGYGVHQCLGQPFARVEMQVALETLTRRIPTLRLAAPLDEIPFKYTSAVHGVHAIPVTW